MAQIMQDKYVLGQSPTQSITAIGQEIRIDMELVTSSSALNTVQVTEAVPDINIEPTTN